MSGYSEYLGKLQFAVKVLAIVVGALMFLDMICYFFVVDTVFLKALVFPVVLVCYGIFAFLLFVTYEFGKAAGMKGHQKMRYFWIAFFLPIAGYMLVIALPDRRDDFVPQKQFCENNDNELPEI